MMTKRLRIFAGPNGSGKSTFISKIKKDPPVPNFHLGYYVNADDIEELLQTKGYLNFGAYGLKIATEQIQAYLKKSKFSPVRSNNPGLWKNFSVLRNKLKCRARQKINSYVAADIAEFIRQQIEKTGVSFSYETVMSDKRKISFLKRAKKDGYKIYLYYFATEDPLINVNRVLVRVALQGHHVKKETIEKRYYKSLRNLKAAIKLSDRAYIFDNSQKASVLIAEITEGKNVFLIDSANVPNWVIKYLS